jgi:RNA polymerase sigma-70 factor (ECF subfamily)
LNSNEISDPDGELLRAALAAPEGDLRAFEELMRRHQKRILADCRYLTGDQINAEDLAQEVFVKMFFGMQSFEGRSSFRHWLQRIKVNHCLNHLKKREGRSALAIDDDAVAVEGLEQLQTAPTADREIETAEKRKRVDEILNSMPDSLRIPLVLCDMDELSYDEIAGALGLGLSAIKMRIKRAREHFKNLYQAAGETAR